MKRILTIILTAFALLTLSSFSAKADDVNTGDANSNSYVCNIVNTNSNYINWFNNNCVNLTLTPTPTPMCTPTPTLTPTIAITPTPTLTPTPTIEACANGGCNSNPGGPGDGLSDGRSDGRSDGGSSSPQPIQAVLGLSTTSSNSNGLVEFAQILAALGLSFAGFTFYKNNAK